MDDWTELTNAPVVGRSVQPAHIFFRGDLPLAQQRIGVARKVLGYAEFDQRIGKLGFTAKVVTLPDGTVIRAICHGAQRSILIDVRAVGAGAGEVVPPVHGYQFYTTTPEPQFHQCVETDYFPVGSAVYAPIPKYDPLDPVPANTVELKASPTGSFVETGMGLSHPRYSLGAVIGGTSSCTASLSKLSQAMNAILMVTGSWQVNGIAEYVSYHGLDVYNVLMANPALHQSWVQGDLANSFGLKTVLSPSEYVDQNYDAAPVLLGPWTNPGPPALKTKVPDSDWFGRATLRDVVHPTYGRRHFVIMSAADGRFHCWPASAPLGGDYSEEYGAYGEQAYKGNIVKEYGKSGMPNYPDWVYLSETPFRDFKKPDEASLNPRSTWSFRRDGTYAIGVMMERKVTEGVFKKINYTPDDLGWAVYKALNNKWGVLHTTSCVQGNCTERYDYDYTFDPNITHAPLRRPYIPSEEAIEPLQVKPTANSTESSEIHVDRFGYVEIEFIMALTGPNLQDFSFAPSVVRSGRPDDINTIEHGMLVDIAYARPLAWQGFEALNKMGNKVGLGTGGSLDLIQPDDVLCLFIKAYRHNDQTAVLDAYDGEVTLPEPSKVKALFGRGYPAAHNNVLTLPLAQIHGRGYTYTPDADVVLPPEPHKHVHRPDQTLTSEYPFAPESDEYSKILYTYKSKITDLDLGALSFYYHVRCVAQERKETPILLANGLGSTWDWHPIEYQARSWCAVVLMGRVIDEVSVGPAAIPLPWLQGWVYSGGALALDPDEELIDPNEQRPFRGFGQQQGPLYPMRALRTSYHGVLFNTPQQQEHRFVSYRSLLATENPTTKEISWSFQESPYFYYYLRPTHFQYFHGVMPWFLCGPCAALVDLALSILYAWSYVQPTQSNSDSWTVSYPPYAAGYSESGTTSWGTDPEVSLANLTEETTYHFMLYVYNLYHTFFITSTGESNGWETYNGAIDSQTTTTFMLDCSINQWLSENPFPAANIELSATQFASVTYKYFWRFIKYFKSVIPKDSMAPAIAEEPTLLSLATGYFLYGVALEPRCPPHLYVLPRGSGGSTTNYNKIYPYVPFLEDTIKNQYFIRDFEYGNLVYTHLMHTHFSPVLNDGTSFIRVTPEGHFSYCKQDIFEFNRPVIPEAVFYADYVGPTEQRNNSFSRTPQVAIPWGIEHVGLPHYSEELIKDDITWEALEGVGWFYGALRCSHLDLYRKAYKTPVTAKMYYRDEPVHAGYQDYKPEFKITSAPSQEGYLVNPVMQYDGIAYDWRYWIYPWGQPAHTLITSQELYPDYNTTRKYLRLSPLFF